MKNDKKYNLENELADAGLNSQQTQLFFENMKFVEQALDEHQPVPSADFNDRIKAAVYAEMENNNIKTGRFFRNHIRSIVAAAAMLLLVFSLVFNQMGPNENTPNNGNNTAPVAKIDLSDNPFAQPDLIMEVLMEHQNINTIDGMTLEAVSTMWGQENQNQPNNSSSSRKGKNNEKFA